MSESEKTAPTVDAASGKLFTVAKQKLILGTLIVVLLLALYLTIQWSKLRASYNDIYYQYNSLTSKFPALPVNIGPSRIAFAYEYPALARALMSRPIPQEAAEFLIRLIRVKRIPTTYLLAGAAPTQADFEAKIKSQDTWEAGNLSPGPWMQIPWMSKLVQNYVAVPDNESKDFSIMVLYLYGYEEYVRLRWTSGATSVMSEWNYMFGAEAYPKLAGSSDCGAGAVGSSLVMGAMSGVGVGIMIGGPLGAVFGGLVGIGGALFGKQKCL